MLIALFAVPAHAMTPPGTPITNVAQADYVDPGGSPTNVPSNPDVVVVAVARTPSVTEIFHYAPGHPSSFPTPVGPEQCSTSGTAAGPFIPAPPPTDLAGAPINLGAPVDLLAGGPFHQGEVLFLRVTDHDQNLDPLLVETVVLTVTSTPTGDTEVLILSETGPNTGEFVGHLMTAPPPPVSGDCALSVVAGESVDAIYTDPADGTDSSADAALVDPLGVVFDSQTGARIDGATVTLIDVATGLPAVVFGDDGVSAYPATVLSGGSVTDAGGTVYNFAPGGFRFPFVAPGTYRLDVTPPAGYTFPSVVGNALLQALPGGPYALGPGSRNGNFVVPLGPAVQVDIPLDPSTNGETVLLTKQASRTNASVGEFVQYVLSATMPATGVATPVTIVDRMPTGFRYEPGSLRIDGAGAPDPTISADGRTLNIALGTRSAGERVEVRYVAHVGVAARPGDAHNDAYAVGFGSRSNTARATVRIAASVFEDRTFLIGRVRVGECGSDVGAAHEGVAGVRIFLEDGSYVVTDEHGRYHIAAVSADTHVVQIDTDTLPDQFAPLACPGHSQAGRGFSRFVEPQAGTLWRTDFVVERIPPPSFELEQILESRAAPYEGDFENPFRREVTLDVKATGRDFEGVAAVIMLPEGAQLLPETMMLGETPTTPEGEGGALTIRIPNLTAEETASLRFAIEAPEAAEGSEAPVVRAMVQAKADASPVRTPIASVAGCAGCVNASDIQAVQVDPPPAKRAADAGRGEAAAEPVPDDERYGGAWLAGAPPANAWRYPEPGRIPPIPAIKIGIQHDPALQVRLKRNDELVSALNFDGRAKNPAGTTAISRWRGVDLEEGPNAFVAELLDEAGNVVDRIEQGVHYSGPPVRAVFDEAESVLIADGRIRPVLAVRLYDRFGKPAREGTTGTFAIDAPFQTAQDVERRRTRPITDVGGFGDDQSRYVVDADGIARVPLHPTTVVGEARFRLQLGDDRSEELEAWLEPGEREWILVALGTGTAGLASEDGNDVLRRAADVAKDVYTEGRLAFYAKGTVLGSWLVTAAYDSEAERTRLGELGGGAGLGDRLGQALDPDEHYTLYGDTTEQGHDAPTSSRLYLKVERDRFFALYGDFETGLDATELARYSRTLTGIQTARNGERVRWNAFATDTGQQFLKDEIQGRGVSGLYRLRTGNILPGSERITLETRDRFRGQRVVEALSLSRDVDYDIDYGGGTIHFRRPVQGRDAQFRPIFIVVDYEVDGGGEKDVTAGGRVAVGFAEDAVEVGVSAIHEGGGDLDGRLFGADATWQIDEETQVEAEYARSTNDRFAAANARADAWRVELEHRSERFEANAYAEQQDLDFGLGQQSANAGGTRRFGVDASVQLTEELELDATAFLDENLESGDERAIAEARVDWDAGDHGAHAGVRQILDRGTDAPAETTQLLAGARKSFFDDDLTLHAATELGFGDEGEHGDYADRLLAGADWRITEKFSVFAEDEFTFGDVRRTNDVRVGFRANPWTGATLETAVHRESREAGQRTFADMGLQQLWNVTKNWAVDVSLERSQTFAATFRPDGTDDVFDRTVPPAGGTFAAQPTTITGGGARLGEQAGDYTALSIGTAWSREHLTLTARAEVRFGDLEDQFNVLVGALREHDDYGVSGRLEFFRTEGQGGERESLVDARIGYVHRPLDSHFIWLDQVDVELEDRFGGGFDFRSRRVVNHLKLNHEWDRATQIAWNLSTKWVVDTIDGQRFQSFGNVFGVELRRDIGQRWDVGLHARVRHLFAGGTDGLATSYGVSLGRVLVRNVWVSVGYNFAGFSDREFSRSDYTAQGPFVRVRIKADQETVRELLGWTEDRGWLR